ncbi:lycopene cyclase domain-containing protein [Robertkochia solimangrovi]|uniref:lycopene cyclase domain-containing protein n=1 Tax=Robertkochia solimangrovi TaxID=2213046 RepID=UPI00117EA2F3|nr:lycopene cyclase domain-containing protein [Robertkochia solimangrovi]TRZ42268.1 lycopene cyclase domain-containing protein [Robertkochia solimangrovi]
MKQYYYLLVDLACIIVPFLCSFYPKHAFYKEWKSFFKANFLVALIFLIWDYFFTYWEVWGFNPEYLIKLNIADLPLEEILFFICIPYACVFTYFAMQYLFPLKRPSKTVIWFNRALYMVFLLLGLFYFDKWYTATTFLGTFAFLLFLDLKKIDLQHYYTSYFLILPFFFMSNGLLTGSFIERPIVWYNDAENLGLRIGTIPVEDTIYGLLLIFMNIYLFNFFGIRAANK